MCEAPWSRRWSATRRARSRPPVSGSADDFDVQPALCAPNTVDRVEQKRERPGFAFADERGEARRMADQAGGGDQDGAFLDFAQAIVFERDSGAGQVDDHVGDSQARVQLESAFGIDQLVVIDAVPAKVLTDERRVLGRDAERAARCFELGGQVDQVHDVADVDPALGDGDGQPAATVAQVGNHHAGHVGLEGVLGEDVQAGDAKLTAAFLHLDDDVGRPHEHDVEAAVADDGRFVLAVAGSPHAVSGRLQELDDAVVEVALGGERPVGWCRSLRSSFAEDRCLESEFDQGVAAPWRPRCAGLGQTLEPECEAGPAVVAAAAEHAGQAVVAAATADVESSPEGVVNGSSSKIIWV